MFNKTLTDFFEEFEKFDEYFCAHKFLYAADKKKNEKYLKRATDFLSKDDRKLPNDFIEFYSKYNHVGFWSKRTNDDTRYLKLNNLKEVFGGFKKNYQIKEGKEYSCSKASKAAFYQEMWLELYDDDISFFNLTTRLKQIFRIPNTSHSIAVDFYDSKQDYRIYYHAFNGKDYLVPLSLTLNEFIKLLVYFDLSENEYFWIFFYDKKVVWNNKLEKRQLYTKLKETYGDNKLYDEIFQMLKNKL